MSLHQGASISNFAPVALEKSSESRPAQCQGPSAGPDRPGGWLLARVGPRRAMAARLASGWTLAHWHLPGNALVEFGLRRRLSLKVVPARDGALHLPERGRSGSPQAWRRGGFAQMGLDLARGSGVADEGDVSYLPTAAWAEERKDVPMSAGRWAWLPDSNQRHLARSDAAKNDRKHAAASDPRGIALDLKAGARRTISPHRLRWPGQPRCPCLLHVAPPSPAGWRWSG